MFRATPSHNAFLRVFQSGEVEVKGCNPFAQYAVQDTQYMPSICSVCVRGALISFMHRGCCLTDTHTHAELA